VLNNEDLNQVTWEQRVLSGEPKWETSQNIMDSPYAAYAEMIGLRGLLGPRCRRAAAGGAGRSSQRRLHRAHGSR
jgi:hypothetical protein